MTSHSVIELTEYRTRTCHLSRAEAAAICGAKGVGIAVTPTSNSDVWALTPGSNVGVVALGERRLVIRPKIGVHNVLALMGAITRKEKWMHDPFPYDQDDTLFSAMIRAFLRSLERTVLQGLRHDYIEREDRMVTPRGRLDVRQLVRTPAMPTPVPCQFDDYSADTPLNRLLLASIRRCLVVPGVPPNLRRRLHHIESLFDGVQPDIGFLQHLPIWTPNRLERHYEPTVGLAALILKNLSIRPSSGASIGTTFLVDMNEVVEAFISEGLKERLEPRFRLALQLRSHLDIASEVPIKPDIVALVEGAPRLVADVKYKIVEELDDVKNADLYQVDAYARALGVANAALITCRADESPNAGLASITTLGGTSIELWPLDLTGSTESLNAGMDELADRFSAVLLNQRAA